MGSLYYLHHLRSCAVSTSGPRPGNGTGSSDHGGGDGGGGLGDPADALLWVSILATTTGVALVWAGHEIFSWVGSHFLLDTFVRTQELAVSVLGPGAFALVHGPVGTFALVVEAVLNFVASLSWASVVEYSYYFAVCCWYLQATRGAPPFPPAASVKRPTLSREFVHWRTMARGRAWCEADARAKEERAAAKKAKEDEAHAAPDAADAAPTMQIHKDTPIPAGMGIPKIPASGGIIVTMAGVALAWGAGHETIRENGACILKTLWRGWPTAATVGALAIDLPWVSPLLALPAPTSTIIFWSEGGAGAYHVATTAAMVLAMGFSLLTLAALGVWLRNLTASGGYWDLQPMSETRTGLCPEEEEDAAGVVTPTSWRVSDH